MSVKFPGELKAAIKNIKDELKKKDNRIKELEAMLKQISYLWLHYDICDSVSCENLASYIDEVVDPRLKKQRR